jgi:hypothetical protein
MRLIAFVTRGQAASLPSCFKFETAHFMSHADRIADRLAR